MIKTQTEDINEKLLAQFINFFRKDTRYQPHRISCENYYNGQQKIEKGIVPEGRSDNKIVANWCKYITDVQTGYFIGKAPVYEFAQESVKAQIDEIYERNREDEKALELATDMSIFGVAYELVYFNEEKKLCFSKCDPKGTFLIYSSSIEPAPVAGIRFWEEHKDPQNLESEKIIVGEFYTETEIKKFVFAEGSLSFTESLPNVFGDIPIVEYRNNSMLHSDFFQVFDEQDAYNLTLSNTQDDLQSIANAFLALSGMLGTEKTDIDEANKSRVLLLSEQGQAQFVVKNLDITATKDQRDTLKSDMLQIAQTPDLTDNAFGGNQSGVAMAYKLWGIEQNRVKKVYGFAKAIRERLRLFSKISAIKGEALNQDFKMKFFKNLPDNDEVLSGIVVSLNGIISRRTQLTLLPFVEDVDEELNRIEEEISAIPAEVKNELLGTSEGT